MNYYPYCTNGGWGWFWPGGIIVLILVLIVCRFLWWGGRGRYYRGRYGNRHKSHMDILRQRYASGEITKEEFDKIKKDIGE